VDASSRGFSDFFRPPPTLSANSQMSSVDSSQGANSQPPDFKKLFFLDTDARRPRGAENPSEGHISQRLIESFLRISRYFTICGCKFSNHLRICTFWALRICNFPAGRVSGSDGFWSLDSGSSCGGSIVGDGERQFFTGVAFPAIPERFPGAVQILKGQDLRICTDSHEISICKNLNVHFLSPMKWGSLRMILQGFRWAWYPNHTFKAGYRATEQASQTLISGRKFSNIRQFAGRSDRPRCAPLRHAPQQQRCTVVLLCLFNMQ
jgi:hypothetical protein